MFDICYEEFEAFQEDLKNGSVVNNPYLCDFAYEDEYGLNHIKENRAKFITLANEYLESKGYPFEMCEFGCGEAYLCYKGTKDIVKEKDFPTVLASIGKGMIFS